jgi:hypothetical protein
VRSFFEAARWPGHPRHRLALCDPPSDGLDFFWFFSSSKEEKNELPAVYRKIIHVNKRAFRQTAVSPSPRGNTTPPCHRKPRRSKARRTNQNDHNVEIKAAVSPS